MRKTGVFDVVWHKILDLSHTLEQKTPHPNQTSRQDPSLPLAGGGTQHRRVDKRQNGCKTDETQDRTIARYAGALRALQSRTACGRQRGQEPTLTASRSRESSSHLVPACAELGPMLDALECGHEVAGADRGTLVLGGHQCGFGPDGAHFGSAPALGALGDVGQRQLTLA